jgi:hypothetical protein
MENDTYKVILSGKPAGNRDLEDVKRRMAALFKTSTAMIEKLFAGKQAVIKKNLNIETAKKYVAIIQKAGAECYVAKMADSAASATVRPPQEAPVHADAPAGPSLKVIPVQTTYKGEERFFPQQMDKLAASSNGMTFNAEGFVDIDYARIAAVAAYSPIESNGESIRFLLYLKEHERPFVFDAGSIDYQSFQKDSPAKVPAAFRSFLYFLCRQNTGMILEETTFDFLSGNTLPGFTDEKAMKYVTAIGRLIEDGGEGEEG